MKVIENQVRKEWEGDDQQTRQVKFLKGRGWKTLDGQKKPEAQHKQEEVATKRNSPFASQKPQEIPEAEFILNPMQGQWRKGVRKSAQNRRP